MEHHRVTYKILLAYLESLQEEVDAEEGGMIELSEVTNTLLKLEKLLGIREESYNESGH